VEDLQTVIPTACRHKVKSYTDPNPYTTPNSKQSDGKGLTLLSAMNISLTETDIKMVGVPIFSLFHYEIGHKVQQKWNIKTQHKYPESQFHHDY